jgi:hypothetical protein
MSQNPSSQPLGDAVIKIRGDLSALPGDLAVARKMAEDGLGARPGNTQPGGKGPGPGGPAVPKAVDETTDSVNKGKQAWDEYNQSTGKNVTTGRDVVQSARNQIAAFTGLISTVTTVTATFVALAAAGYKVGQNLFNNRYDVERLKFEYEKLAHSVRSFAEARDAAVEKRFGQQITPGQGIQNVAKEVTRLEAEKLALESKIREKEESGWHTARRGWDTAMMGVGLGGFATGADAELTVLQEQLDTTMSFLQGRQKQFQGMMKAGGAGTPRNDQAAMNIEIIADTNVEMLRSQQFNEVGRPR